MSKKMMEMDDDVENVGIMQGFMDSMNEDEDGEAESEDDDEGVSLPEMERRPNSPEILMNNLRGDMRSVDARRDELADLVGYKAATETPDSVLAMLQPVLAQQGGLGALPQSQAMAQGPQPPMPMPMPMPPGGPGVGEPMGGPLPPGGIADMLGAAGAPPMPPGAGMPPPPQPQAAPIGMAKGGYVQHFQAGSDEEGVTPVDQNPSADLMQYPPELVEAAKQASASLLRQRPTALPTLQEATAARLPEYTKLLGPDRDMSQAQMLLDLGQRAFAFAANTDEQGRPLRGGFLSRLAGATKTLPTAINKRLDEIGKIDRQLKVLALQQGEKDIDQVTAQNTELQKRKNSLLAEVLRAQSRLDAKKAGASGPLGKGSKGDILNNLITFAPLYQAGSLTPEQENTFITAVTDYTQPTLVQYTDPETGLLKVREQRNQLPEFVSKALNSRRPGSAPAPAAAADAGAPNVPGLPSAAAPTRRMPAPMGLTEKTAPAEVFQAASAAPKSSFFDLAGTGTGFVPVLVAGVARNVPLEAAGRIGPEFQQSTAMLHSMTNRVVNTLQENPRFAEGERQQILRELQLAPRLFANKQGYINQLIGLDNVLEGIEQRTMNIRDNEKAGITARQAAIKKLEEISAVRELMGIQQRTIRDPAVWRTLPPGEYIVPNPDTGFLEYRRKKG